MSAHAITEDEWARMSWYSRQRAIRLQLVPTLGTEAVDCLGTDSSSRTSGTRPTRRKPLRRKRSQRRIKITRDFIDGWTATDGICTAHARNVEQLWALLAHVERLGRTA